MHPVSFCDQRRQGFAFIVNYEYFQRQVVGLETSLHLSFKNFGIAWHHNSPELRYYFLVLLEVFNLVIASSDFDYSRTQRLVDVQRSSSSSHQTASILASTHSS